MSKPTGPIVNGTSADVTIAGWISVFFGVLVGLGLYGLGLSGSVAVVIGLVVFFVGIIVGAVKTVG